RRGEGPGSLATLTSLGRSWSLERQSPAGRAMAALRSQARAMELGRPSMDRARPSRRPLRAAIAHLGLRWFLKMEALGGTRHPSRRPLRAAIAHLG
ncbi:MAG TPA: hypothetical protein VNI57_12410, partial [Candidatus Saccharimonadales bacterium]|nr:hypothetical protein [Candidatus Saccharimonadales bacterium]